MIYKLAGKKYIIEFYSTYFYVENIINKRWGKFDNKYLRTSLDELIKLFEEML